MEDEGQVTIYLEKDEDYPVYRATDNKNRGDVEVRVDPAFWRKYKRTLKAYVDMQAELAQMYGGRNG